MQLVSAMTVGAWGGYLLPCEAALVQHKALQPSELLLLAAGEAAGQVEPVLCEVDELQLWQFLADACDSGPAANKVVGQIQLLQVRDSSRQFARSTLEMFTSSNRCSKPLTLAPAPGKQSQKHQEVWNHQEEGRQADLLHNCQV